MENRKLLNFEKLILPIFIIGIGVLFRFLPHPPNFVPIAAIALFGGVYLNKKYALILPIIIMILSDLILGFSASTPLVYLSFFITSLIGLFLAKRKHFSAIFLASVSSSVIFFVLTNLNYWYAASLYPKTFDGMVEAYLMAIPFFRNTLIGDLVFVGIFFGVFEIFSRFSKHFIYGRTNLYRNR